MNLNNIWLLIIRVSNNKRFNLKFSQIIKKNLMSRGMYTVPKAYNEPVKNYAPGSPERKELKKRIKELLSILTLIEKRIWQQPYFGF